MAPARSIVLGIAAVRRKLYSPPMQAIVSSLSTSNPSFTIVLLDEYQMESEPVSKWPVVHVLLTMYNPEFPLEKVLAYCDLRRPVLVNNLHMQRHMMDRREIRRVLERAAVPTPHAVFVDREAGDVVEQTGADGDTLVVRNVKRKKESAICKPFVEKPVDPDDHNVYIYYKGGGVRKLFRKTKLESSRLDPAETQVRTSGSYVYEAFYEPEQCADVKVYAVGDFFYAQARKAPHIDGIVERDQRGRERRIPVSLSLEELEICRKATAAFDQFVLGFDLLRGPGRRRFVIDVNGWSLVKNSDDYASQCGKVLAEHIVSLLDKRADLTDEQMHAQNRTSLLQSSAQQPSSQSNPELFDPSQGSPCVA